MIGVGVDGGREGWYHPAAFESAEDSLKGAAIHGLGTSGPPMLPILKNL